MADRDRIRQLEYTAAQLERQIQGLIPVRLGDSSGDGAETYRLIRGQSVGIQGGATILIDNVLEIAGGLDPSGGNPATQITVQNLFGQSFADNEAVQAIYHAGLGGSITSDWETIKTAVTSETPPLYRFELTVAKATIDLTATAKWLDHAGNLVGGDITIYDPGNKFYGKAANYVGTITGFRGFAIQRTDLAAVDPARFEIIAMEGFARWVVVTYAGSPDNEWQLTSFGGDQWQWKRPVADSTAVTIVDPAGVNPDPVDGDIAIAELENPDTSPPTYQLRAFPGSASIVVKITSAITARVTTTPGSGSAQPVDPTDLTVNVGGAVTVYNLSSTSVTGSSGSPVYWKATRMGGLYFLDVFDTVAFPAYDGTKDQSIGHDASALPTWQDDDLCPPEPPP